MDVKFRQLGLQGAADLEVGVAGESRMDSALEADLHGAAFPGLPPAPHDLAQRDEIRPAAQVRSQPSLREGAEAAAEVADVRVVDVARDDVGDGVAVHQAPQPVGRREDPVQLVAASREEPGDLVLAQYLAGIDRQRIAWRERYGGMRAGRPAV